MQLKFESIHMKNFMSYEDAQINFTESGYTIVQGVNLNKDDSAVSNGAGKSTCFEAIVWALTGDTIRGTSDVKRFGAEDKCEVELNFSIDKVTYRIIRTKDPSNLFFYVDDINKSGKGIRDTSLLLKEYLPDLTAQLIGSVVIMGQGLPMRFSNNSPAGRKDVLEKLSKSDFMIEDLKAKVISRKTQLNNLKRQYEDFILSKNTIINSKTVDVKNYTTELDTLNKIEYDSIIEAKQLIIDTNSNLLQKLEINKDSIQLELEKIMSEQRTTSEEKFIKIQEITDKYQTLIEEQNSLSIKDSNRAAVLNKEINTIKNINTHCPTCGQELKGVKKPDATPLLTELDEINQRLNTIKLKIKDLNSELAQEKSKITNSYSEICQQQADKINKYKSDIQRINIESNSYTTLINTTTTELNNIIIKKQNHAYKVEQLTQAIRDAENEIKTATEDYDKTQTEVENVKLHLEVINKFEGALKRDFRGILLNNIIKYIDLRAKEYSNIVFGTDKIGFVLDGNNISITYCNKDYTNLSGGEKQRVDLIVQFALRDMLCKYLNFSSNILVLDEIVDNLDSIGCQKIMELISMKLNDVDSIYIISHHSDIQMPYDHELVIIKNEDGISNVQYN